ncbi:FGGY family carbohydrate kinase [Hymenobacter jejuensis]|nr:FGGY family carbohydrate kinase [Hymenobacter jejuensis]
MKKKSIYAVFDIGQTNKKLILFDENRQIIDEHQHVCTDAQDEDGYPCEDLPRLTQWVRTHWQMLRQHPFYRVKGVNFTAYGAGLVYLDQSGQPFLPLYSYLRPFPAEYAAQFYASLGQSREEFAQVTRSPQLGMLHAGMQLYWLKYARPEQYDRVHTALYLPHYLSYLITGQVFSDYSSVGCHTALWDFTRNTYHDWVLREGFDEKLAPLINDSVATVEDGILIGVGMEDSSAAVMSYMFENRKRPFVFVSTGTWSVTFNPFNKQPLTPELLQRNCVNYLSPRGEPTVAARLFIGREHDYQVQRIAEYFHTKPDFYRSLLLARPTEQLVSEFEPTWMLDSGQTVEPACAAWPLVGFNTATDAYQHLMHHLVRRLKQSIDLVRQDEDTLFVDGGFARNPVFMQMLQRHYPAVEVRTPEVPQATALGALIHLEQGEAQKKTEALFA